MTPHIFYSKKATDENGVELNLLMSADSYIIIIRNGGQQSVVMPKENGMFTVETSRDDASGREFRSASEALRWAVEIAAGDAVAVDAKAREEMTRAFSAQ